MMEIVWWSEFIKGLFDAASCRDLKVPAFKLRPAFGFLFALVSSSLSLSMR